MIAYIKGNVQYIGKDYIILESNNIGYEIKVPLTLCNEVYIGSEVKIYTYMYIREDVLCLYGFISQEYMELFKLLITVNGVGPKAALSILSIMNCEEFKIAVITNDKKKIAKAQGIGQKMVSKIILELQDKIDMSHITLDNNIQKSDSDNDTQDIKNDAIMALIALGYTQSIAQSAVNKVNISSDMDSGIILKLALKNIM